LHQTPVNIGDFSLSVFWRYPVFAQKIASCIRSPIKWRSTPIESKSTIFLRNSEISKSEYVSGDLKLPNARPSIRSHLGVSDRRLSVSLQYQITSIRSVTG